MSIAEQLEHLAAMSRQDPADWSRIRWRLLVVLEDGDRAESDKHPGRIVDDVLGNSARAA